MILRIQLNSLLSARMKTLPLLSSIPESTRTHILEAVYSDKVRSFCESIKDSHLPLPSEIQGILDSVLETEKHDAEEPSRIIEKLVQFLRLRVSYSVDELSSSKAKAEIASARVEDSLNRFFRSAIDATSSSQQGINP